MGYFTILTAIPGFFLSSLFLMLLWGVISLRLDIPTIDYVTAMLVNISLWLAVAPLVATGRLGFFRFAAVIPGFFLSSFLLMLLWGAIAPGITIVTIGYPLAMLVTITLWIAVFPLSVAGRRKW